MLCAAYLRLMAKVTSPSLSLLSLSLRAAPPPSLSLGRSFTRTPLPRISRKEHGFRLDGRGGTRHEEAAREVVPGHDSFLPGFLLPRGRDGSRSSSRSRLADEAAPPRRDCSPFYRYIARAPRARPLNNRESTFRRNCYFLVARTRTRRACLATPRRSELRLERSAAS